MNRFKGFLLCLTLVLAPGFALAQTGSISGKITDAASRGELIGANVFLVGTTLGSSTDLDGRYRLDSIPAGTYDLRVTYAGYNAKVVTGLEIPPGEELKLDIDLEPLDTGVGDAFEIEDLIVSAEKVLGTGAAILADRKISATIGDAISADMISRSPDATSGDALRRVTGLTVVDDKFVFIRGVTDRYNTTSLNGVTVQSTDTRVDRKSFSFDLVPASLLANTVVVKTATPDLPGDFSGGAVKVNTLEFPTEKVVKLSISSAYDDATTNRPMLDTQGGDTDWLGIDDGARRFPAGDLSGNALARGLPNNWAIREKDAGLNRSLNFALGDRFRLGEDELGFLGAISYKSGFTTEAFEEGFEFDGVPWYHYDGFRYKYNVLWGGLLNLNYKLSGLHKLSFKNNYNQAAEEKVKTERGLPIQGDFAVRQSSEWNERSLWLSHLSGEHAFLDLGPGRGDLDVEWKIFRSESEARQPDRKYVERSPSAFQPDMLFLKNNYRTWSDLGERSRGLNLDLTYELENGRQEWQNTKFKVGSVLELRERDYSIKAFTTRHDDIDSQYREIRSWSIESMFIPENYDEGKFQFAEFSGFTGNYSAEHDLKATYLMLDQGFSLSGQRMRVAGGVRLEDSDLLVDASAASGGSVGRIQKSDLLPSVNLTWVLDDRTNVRLAYYKSVNRPEFRELADVLYFDFDKDQNVRGNPDLERAVIDSYDARVEIFPSPGEVLAASVFYKKIENAIEEELTTSPERFVQSWFNSPRGENYGFELEARQSLGFLGGFFERFTFTGNYTLIESAVDWENRFTLADGTEVREIKQRDMQGQSPWTINLSLLFMDPELGTSINVLYNKFGRRLDSVGERRETDIYEEGRKLIDLAVSQQVRDSVKAKFTIKNLLGEDEFLTYGDNEDVFSKIGKGTVYSLSLAFDL